MSPKPRDRDVLVRKDTPRAGVPETWDDGITGNYDGDDLRRMRAMREDGDRLARLEDKDDKHEEDISAIKDSLADVKLSVADIRGEQKATTVAMRGIERTLERMAAREHVEYSADADVKKAKRLDTINAGADKRKFWLSIGTALIGGGALGKLLHWLGVF